MGCPRLRCYWSKVPTYIRYLLFRYGVEFKFSPSGCMSAYGVDKFPMAAILGAVVWSTVQVPLDTPMLVKGLCFLAEASLLRDITRSEQSQRMEWLTWWAWKSVARPITSRWLTIECRISFRLPLSTSISSSLPFSYQARSTQFIKALF